VRWDNVGLGYPPEVSSPTIDTKGVINLAKGHQVDLTITQRSGPEEVQGLRNYIWKQSGLPTAELFFDFEDLKLPVSYESVDYNIVARETGVLGIAGNRRFMTEHEIAHPRFSLNPERSFITRSTEHTTSFAGTLCINVANTHSRPHDIDEISIALTYTPRYATKEFTIRSLNRSSDIIELTIQMDKIPDIPDSSQWLPSIIRFNFRDERTLTIRPQVLYTPSPSHPHIRDD
jgi:hypothetical protein